MSKGVNFFEVRASIKELGPVKAVVGLFGTDEQKVDKIIYFQILNGKYNSARCRNHNYLCTYIE